VIEVFRKILSSKLFWFGLLIRILLMFVVPSEFMMDKFIPFVDKAVTQFPANPWMLSSPADFPYGLVLFVLFFVPKMIFYTLFGELALGNSILSVVLMKFPLLIFDVGFLVLLTSIFEINFKRLQVYYWLNPVVIYISYLHGQLDLIVMFFTVLAIYQLMQKNILSSSVCFAAAILSKFHVIILIPFFMAYIWNTHFLKQALVKILTWSGVLLILVGFGLLPNILAQNADYISAGSPEALRVFAMQFKLSETHVLYIGLFLLFATIARMVFSTKISEDGLFFGSGLIMGALLLITNPMPGWYFWVMPFFAIFWARYYSASKLIFAAMILLYFGYFELFNKMPDPLMKSLVLTALQVTLLGAMLSIYNYVITFESPITERGKTYILGLSGDSGAGKNYFTGLISDLFSESSVQVIEGDDYHKWERRDPNWEYLTHLNPFSNHLKEMMNHIRLISMGRSFHFRHYNHQTGKFTQPRELVPSKTVVMQGLHSLFSEDFRDAMNLKIFLDPQPELRLAWKLERDSKDRKHDRDSIVKSFEARKLDGEKYIIPQRGKSDWVIRYCFSDSMSVEQILNGERRDLQCEYEIKADPGVLDFLMNLKELSCQVEIMQDTGSIDTAKVRISGKPSAEMIQAFAEKWFLNIRQLTRSYWPPKWRNGLEGIHQLMILYFLTKTRG
jgi:uridine kinase